MISYRKKAQFFIVVVLLHPFSLNPMDQLSFKNELQFSSCVKNNAFDNLNPLCREETEELFFNKLKNSKSKEVSNSYNCLKNIFLFLWWEKTLPREVVHTIFHLSAHALLESALRYNFELTQILHGHSDGITSVAISSDGKIMLTGSKDHKIVIWNRKDASFLHELTGHTNSISSVAFSPNATKILTGSLDHTARLWDVETGQEIFQLKHYAGVSSITFSPDGTKILTGSFDCTARLWDACTGIKLLKIPHPGQVVSVAFNFDNKTIITRSLEQYPVVFDITTHKQLSLLELFHFDIKASSPSRPDEIIKPVAFSPDSKTILLGSMSRAPYLLDLETGEKLFQFDFQHSLNSLVFDSKGKTVIFGSRVNVAIVNVKTGHRLSKLSFNDNSQVTSVACDADNQTILVGTRDTNAYLFSIFCDAYKWITTATDPLQVCFITLANESKKTDEPWIILENTFEYELFIQLPPYVQEYLLRWYPIRIT
ncbi:WD40 repeat domain-containing protein [Candidatus Dependentiae bacterium]|nr:WD40 repeat domain-containing protein [Candidatus Dependentiae bacterium]